MVIMVFRYKISFKMVLLTLLYFSFQFRAHAKEYYPLLSETMMYDLKQELRSILRKFFIRTGIVFGITPPHAYKSRTLSESSNA